MSSSELYQGCFRFLSVPDFQPISCNRDGTNHDEVFYSGSPCKERMVLPDLNKYVPLNYINPEAYAFLVSAEASAARCAEERAAAMESDADGSGTNLSQNALTGWQSPSMPPPRKFYRTFWHSISLRLLRQRARVLLLSSRPATVPMQA